MRISDWSSDVCSSDLAAPDLAREYLRRARGELVRQRVERGHGDSERIGERLARGASSLRVRAPFECGDPGLRHTRFLRQLGLRQAAVSSPRSQRGKRSEEHTSELQSLMRISYAVFCLKKKNNKL